MILNKLTTILINKNNELVKSVVEKTANVIIFNGQSNSSLALTPIEAIVDWYSNSNADGQIQIKGGSFFSLGQCFIGDGSFITKAKFYLQKSGSPTGYAYAKLYAMSGTYGTNGIPTGDALVVSDGVNVATDVSTVKGLVTFTFSTPYTMVLGTNYVIQCEFTGGNSVYSESSFNDYDALDGISMITIGQSFKGNGKSLSEAKFYLAKTGSPTGYAYAKLYAHTGAYGSGGKATGAALATSDPVLVSDIPIADIYALTDFNFRSPYLLTKDTVYVIAFEGTGVNSSNYLRVAGVSPGGTDPGNDCYSLNGTDWTALANDLCFYVLGK